MSKPTCKTCEIDHILLLGYSVVVGRHSLKSVLFSLSSDINRAIELLDKLQRTGEVPPQKLQALQRVLQSEFCNAVREV